MHAIVRTVNRRQFVETATLVAVSLGALGVPAAGPPIAKRKFAMGLACGLIGVPGDPK